MSDQGDTMEPDPKYETYEAKRIALAKQHDLGAASALADAVSANSDVRCGSYCYGGSARLDVEEALADLADDGWRIVRAQIKET